MSQRKTKTPLPSEVTAVTCVATVRMTCFTPIYACPVDRRPEHPPHTTHATFHLKSGQVHLMYGGTEPVEVDLGVVAKAHMPTVVRADKCQKWHAGSEFQSEVRKTLQEAMVECVGGNSALHRIYTLVDCPYEEIPPDFTRLSGPINRSSFLTALHNGARGLTVMHASPSPVILDELMEGPRPCLFSIKPDGCLPIHSMARFIGTPASIVGRHVQACVTRRKHASLMAKPTRSKKRSMPEADGA